MKNISIISLFSVLIIGCTIFQNSSDSNLRIEGVQEYDYGICDTRLLYKEKMENTPGGNHDIVQGFKILKQTDTIPCELGKQFGLSYKLKANIPAAIPIQINWIYPERIKMPTGKKQKKISYIVEKYTNERTFSVYTLEEKTELLRGEWKFQIFYKNKKLFERSFYLK